ncbi:butyrophilin subfamily 3 member A2-like isoform X2 [Micropterus salmoides]|uniref:butyrophilin subfamily 3 member A2-like isoform X2 n=1 Tax=Micropterus salmoides TaxID=27706 RepID=UPI0018EB17FA|nr:butyrophilin subfamily 3 member A2-like isoform X2 [Micropterus salmoides]
MQQSYRMLHQTDGLSLQSPVRPLSVLVFHLLLTHSCRGNSYTGQPQLIGPSQPIVATLGDDIILPCHLKPAEDASGLTLEWTRPDLNPRFVHVWRSGQELVGKKHQSFEGRTSLFIDELKFGNILLKLSKLKLKDEGTYRCFSPAQGLQSFVQLIVGAVSSPVITLAGIVKATSGVVLQCESAGWYPEPEVFWLDGEGNLLSAGPTETVRGPDDLYTVSSRVTVEKRHSNSFTCRVQQKDINQTRDTHIQVTDDFFEVQSSSLSTIIGLAVSLAACILLMSAAIVFFVYNWRQNELKTKRSCCDGEMKNLSKNYKFVAEGEREQQQLMTVETVQMKFLNNGEGKKTKHKVPDSESSQSRQQDGTSSAGQSSTAGHVIVDEVDKSRKYIGLKNTSSEDQELGGWTLKVQVNDRAPISYTFKKPLKLSPGKKVIMWVQGCGTNYPPSDLVWDDLKSWSPKDKLQFFLISNTEEIQHFSVHSQ